MKILCPVFLGCSLFAMAHTAIAGKDYFDMTLEELMNVQVSPTPQKAESLPIKHPEIFIISQQDIKKSGATTLPQALTLAPGLIVNKTGANSWAISMRSLTDQFPTKPLILINGRSDLNPARLDSSLKTENLPIKNIKRIEIIQEQASRPPDENTTNVIIDIITSH